MNWIEGLVYGFISGITEFIPASSQAHQRVLLQIFGAARDPIVNLIVHISALLALYIGSRSVITRMRREQRLLTAGKRRANNADMKIAYDLRLIRTSLVPMLLAMLALVFTRRWADNNVLIALFALLNGIVIFISERFPHGNKDSRHMSVFDAVLFGLTGAVSVFPGVSRIGASTSYASMRGVSKQQAFNWALLLSIPALIILCIFDIVDIVTANGLLINWTVIAGYITSCFGAFIGAYICVFFIRALMNRSGVVIFAYYSWGMALLMFVLYLIS